MALAVVEEGCGVLVAHGEESHGTTDIGVVAADNVAGGDVDHVLTLVGEEGGDLVVSQADRGPAGEEDGTLDAALVSVKLSTAGLLEDKGGSGGGALGVAQDAIDLGVVLEHLEDTLHGVVDGLAAVRLLLTEQLAHGVLGAHALGNVADLGEHVVETADTIELHVAEQRGGTEVVLEALGRGGLPAAIDPEELDVGVLLNLLNERTELDLEVLLGEELVSDDDDG